jgi:rhomboid protease GluP
MSWKHEEFAKEKQKELRKEIERAREEKLSLHDIPKITFSLALANIAIFIFFSSQSNYESIVLQWGFTPNNLAQLKSLPTFITHMFLHADFLHIFFNMLIFVQFGYLCERKIGMLKFALLYFMCGIFSVLFHTFFNIGSEITLVGASGAIFGVLASCALLYPGRPVYLRLKYTRKKAPLIVGVFFVFLLETLYAFAGINPYIAHTAHLGGGIAGVFMIALLFPRKAAQFLSDLIDAMIPVVPEQTEDTLRAN